jgi:hypothetical protein
MKHILLGLALLLLAAALIRSAPNPEPEPEPEAEAVPEADPFLFPFFRWRLGPFYGWGFGR